MKAGGDLYAAGVTGQTCSLDGIDVDCGEFDTGGNGVGGDGFVQCQTATCGGFGQGRNGSSYIFYEDYVEGEGYADHTAFEYVGLTDAQVEALGLCDSCQWSGLGFSFSPQGSGGAAPNNGRNCSVAPASAGQYVAATAESALLTSEFASGLGATNQTFGPNTATSQVLGQSAGVQEVLGAYLITGQSSGLYTFGASGAYVNGGNPVAQFVGSFRYSISGGVLSITNTTSLRSLTYDHGPQYQRGSFPTPGGNIHQTFQIGLTCK